jgi:hypothetical protein
MAGDGCRQPLTGRQALGSSSHTTTQPGGVHDPAPRTSEEHLDQAVETAVERAIFGGNELARRHFLQLVGASAATAIIRSAFPLETAKALAQENAKDIEKKDLTVSFIPITCATPIIMAEPMGFYARHGLNVTVRRAAGWAVVRDWAINQEVDATHMLSPMLLSITPKNYLNQPVVVVEQVLTGRYADGLGNIKEVPDRIGFDPFPWHSMAVWILTQMKRWKQIDGALDYKKVAEQVYLASECDKVSRELGYPAHGRTYTTHMIMGQVFDPEKPEAYVESFAIRS